MLPRDGALIEDDLLRGLDEIAAYIREHPVQTSLLIKQGIIPAGKIGRVYIASKRRLSERYSELTAGGSNQVRRPRRKAASTPTELRP